MAAGKIQVERWASSPGNFTNALRMSRRLINAILITALVACPTTLAVGQTHTTVRHYKEPVNDQPPEIAQAEAAIQKNDFAGAETLLKKALGNNPNNDPNSGQAWL